MRDSYERFFKAGYVSKEQFFSFGLDETIYAPYEEAQQEWANLKTRIQINDDVFIRSVGRKGSGTPLMQAFYQIALDHQNIKEDPTNNAEPAKLIRQLTGYSKTENKKFELIQNYQISHIFSRTKNAYAFTAPWNIAYVPKLLDPFTGHEAKGEMIEEFTTLFQHQGYMKFAPLIDDYNGIMTSEEFRENINNALSKLEGSDLYSSEQIKRLRETITNDFKPIEL